MHFWGLEPPRGEKLFGKIAPLPFPQMASYLIYPMEVEISHCSNCYSTIANMVQLNFVCCRPQRLWQTHVFKKFKRKKYIHTEFYVNADRYEEQMKKDAEIFIQCLSC